MTELYFNLNCTISNTSYKDYICALLCYFRKQPAKYLMQRKVNPTFVENVLKYSVCLTQFFGKSLVPWYFKKINLYCVSSFKFILIKFYFRGPCSSVLPDLSLYIKRASELLFTNKTSEGNNRAKATEVNATLAYLTILSIAQTLTIASTVFTISCVTSEVFVKKSLSTQKVRRSL